MTSDMPFREMQYLTIKIPTCRGASFAWGEWEWPPKEDKEIAMSQYLGSLSIGNHHGDDRLRTPLETFSITGPRGHHKCLLYKPLGMSLRHLLEHVPGKRLPKDVAQKISQQLLVPLDYLHRCNVIHRGICIGVLSS